MENLFILNSAQVCLWCKVNKRIYLHTNSFPSMSRQTVSSHSMQLKHGHQSDAMVLCETVIVTLSYLIISVVYPIIIF